MHSRRVKRLQNAGQAGGVRPGVEGQGNYPAGVGDYLDVGSAEGRRERVCGGGGGSDGGCCGGSGTSVAGASVTGASPLDGGASVVAGEGAVDAGVDDGVDEAGDDGEGVVAGDDGAGLPVPEAAGGAAPRGPAPRITAATTAAASNNTAIETAATRRRPPAKTDHMLHLGTSGPSRGRAERPAQ